MRDCSSYTSVERTFSKKERNEMSATRGSWLGTNLITIGSAPALLGQIGMNYGLKADVPTLI